MVRQSFIRALVDIRVVAQHLKEKDAGVHTDIGANGSALPRLLECDMCAAKVVLRAGRQRVDPSYELLPWHNNVMHEFLFAGPAGNTYPLVVSVSLPLPNKALNRPCREIKLKNWGLLRQRV
jgi:hypothetical protein